MKSDIEIQNDMAYRLKLEPLLQGSGIDAGIAAKKVAAVKDISDTLDAPGVLIAPYLSRWKSNVQINL